jgi:hypothetical protein
MDRHHVRHEKLFIRQFERNPARVSNPKYGKLKRRYGRFNKKDIVHLCRDCHEVIHQNYYDYLNYYLGEKGVWNVFNLTWSQAEALMRRFYALFIKWIEQEGDFVDESDWPAP